MYKFRDFILGIRPFSYLTMAISIAASWAWGVSIVVGMQTFQNKGLGAFLIWALANSLTLALCGYAMSKVPASVLRLPEIIPGQLRKAYDGLILLIQFFSLLVNMVAIKTAFGMLQIEGLWWMVLCSVIFLAVLARGFDVTVRNNLLFFSLWVSLLLVAIILHAGSELTVKLSTGSQIGWGFYGALILLCAPILDQQMWQYRAAANQGEGKKNPFYLAAGLFALYMALIAFVAALGATTNLLVAAVILMVAGTTLVSALSAISTFFGRFITARSCMCGVFALAAACAVFNISVLQWWTAYGTIRIPFALLAFAVIAWKVKRRLF